MHTMQLNVLSLSLQHVPPVVQLMDVFDPGSYFCSLFLTGLSFLEGVINLHNYIFISLTAAFYHLSCAATASTHL